MVKNLKKYREKSGLSQAKLAAILGISQQSIYKYEKTDTEPDISILINMAKLFNITVDELIGYSAESDSAYTIPYSNPISVNENSFSKEEVLRILDKLYSAVNNHLK